LSLRSSVPFRSAPRGDHTLAGGPAGARMPPRGPAPFRTGRPAGRCCRPPRCVTTSMLLQTSLLASGRKYPKIAVIMQSTTPMICGAETHGHRCCYLPPRRRCQHAGHRQHRHGCIARHRQGDRDRAC